MRRFLLKIVKNFLKKTNVYKDNTGKCIQSIINWIHRKCTIMQRIYSVWAKTVVRKRACKEKNISVQILRQLQQITFRAE